MEKFEDLTGVRFGRLVAVEPVQSEKSLKWRCSCDCGGEAITTGSKLKSGHTKSCGCLQRERTSQASIKDLSQKRFGRLKVIERVSSMGERAKYRCVCDCGNIIVADGGNLVTGKTKSCGCIRKELASKLKLSHGKHGTRLYRCWRNMISRCEDPSNKEYKNYGARKITVCDNWRSDFQAFYKWALENGYCEELTIERIDVNKGYSPENCTWADVYTQARNKCNNVFITHNGRTMILEDWARETGISSKTIRNRIKSGWAVSDALKKRPTGAARRRW